MRAKLLLLALVLGCEPATSDSGKDSDEPVDVDGDGRVADDDCDEADGTVYVGAPELCDGVDNDCDGAVDDDATDAGTWYADADADGYGDPGQVELACAAPAGSVAVAGDYDDGDAAWNPGAVEDDCTDANDYDCDGIVAYADADGDGTAACEDCDDADPAVFPGATELCNGTDDDCDGATDEEAADGRLWYEDVDADGYGTAITAWACEAPEGFAAYDGDCDDADNNYNPGAPETDCTDPNDYNCDGSVGYADADGDGWAACTECDDGDATHFPDAPERCDGVDDDCDGTVDEPDAIDAPTWYADVDADGYGDAATPEVSCEEPSGYTADDQDCDDSDADEHPGADERCDGDDDDCDGETDEDSAIDATTWYADADTDGYGDAATSTVSCSAPGGYITDATDCDDTDLAEYPGATELCDGDDDDCDGEVDEDSAADAGTWYADADADGYGDAASTAVACAAPTGFVGDATDCDDTAAAVSPAGTEVCNGVDDNCDGDVDEATATDALSWYADSDGDSFGDASVVQVACEVPAGYSALDTDCDDADATEYPGATERCDGDDDDCDAEVDEDGAIDVATWYADADADGYGDAATSDVDCDQPAGFVADATDCDDDATAVNPGAAEVCDAADTDEDCSGTADDDDPTATGQTAWYADADADGYGDAAVSTPACNQPAATVADTTDCDDTDAAIHPGATEVCDAADTDEDCDELADDLDPSATGQGTFYTDADADGYGNLDAPVSACDVASGRVVSSTDCDDDDAAINPAATEVCDAADVDEDCDGDSDDDDASVTGETAWYLDADGDAYGDAAVSVDACSVPAGYVGDDTDCDDDDADTNPGAVEVCDSDDVDEDCDGVSDDDDPSATGQTSWWADTDGDTYGGSTTGVSACEQPSGYEVSSTDCDDTDASENPAATEVCDGDDDDCDEDVDEAGATGESTWYADGDGDGYGTASTSTSACDAPSGYVANTGDCDDNEALAWTGAAEVCDSVDNDCNGSVDDGASSTWYADLDEDGYGDEASTTEACSAPSGYVADATDCDDTDDTVSPGAAEVCEDGLDQNCAIDCRDEEVVDGAGLTYFTGVNGSSATSSFGSKLVGGVDVNGDTLEDFVVGDRLYDSSTSASNMGRVTVFLGTGAGFTDTVANPTATITGTDSAGRFGQGLAAGDLDGDGVDDIIAGTPAVNGFGAGTAALTDNGKASVFLGPFERTAGATTATSASGADCIIEATGARSYLGTSVAFGGDLTDDGTADWVFGAHQSYTGYLQGYVGIVNTGSCSSTLSSSASIHTITGSAGDVFGHSVLGDVDLDGDGVDDLLVSAAAADSVYVFLGPVAATARTDADASVTGMDFYYSTSGPEDNYGDRLAIAGDTDLDGYVELLVGSSSYDVGTNTSAGAAFLISGEAALLAGTETGPNLASVSVLGGSTTFNVGAGVSPAGDVDADGAPDFIVGFGADTPASTAFGASALFYGGASGSYSPSLSATPSGYAMYSLEATTTSVGGAGGAAAALGDVDTDGFDDFMVANMNYGSTRVGRTYLVFGSGE